MKNTEDKIQTIKIRVAGYLTLFFLLGFIISLIITINTSTVDENNQNVYSVVGMSINMIFAFLTVIGLIVFLILLFLRFKKQTNGPSLEMTPKEMFKDNHEEGALIEKVTTSGLSYSLLLSYNLYSFKKDIITLIVLAALSLGLSLSFFLTQTQLSLAYALIVLFAISIILILCVFLLPLFYKKEDNYSPLEIYQDKILYEEKERKMKEPIYFSSFFKAKETKKGFFFVFYKSGKQVFFLNKEDMEKETKDFLSLKVRQVYNHNHRKIKK